MIAALVTIGLIAWAAAHQLLVAYIFALLVERLPPPGTDSAPDPKTGWGKTYAYFYSVLQAAVANSQRAQDALKAIRAPKDIIVAPKDN